MSMVKLDPPIKGWCATCGTEFTLTSINAKLNTYQGIKQELDQVTRMCDHKGGMKITIERNL